MQPPKKRYSQGFLGVEGLGLRADRLRDWGSGVFRLRDWGSGSRVHRFGDYNLGLIEIGF